MVLVSPRWWIRTSRGICPGRLCVAQLKQGSKARKAISIRLRIPEVGSTPGRMKDWAAFFVTIWMGALLLVVPTIRFALVQIPFSSQV